MKKHKMIISLAGLVVAVAATATVAAYTLAGDGSSPPTNQTVATQEPAFQDDKPTLDPAPNTIFDGKGGVSVTNPDVDGAAGGTVLAGQGIVVNADDTPVDPPLHGDPPPPVGRPLPEPAAGGTVLAGQGIVVNADDTPVGEVVPDKGDPQFAGR